MACQPGFIPIEERDFESWLIKELLKVLGVRKSHTTPYHPQGDPQPERFNRTLLSTLGILYQEKKRQLSQHVVHFVHAYNSTKCDSTGYSPYYLMFGREARLPVDVCFGTNPDEKGEHQHSSYVAKLKEDLQRAYRMTTEASNKTHLWKKKSLWQETWVSEMSLKLIQVPNLYQMRKVTYRSLAVLA